VAVLGAQACRDVLAVGYGPQHFAPQLPGCVALWSQRNPARPLWAFATASGAGVPASSPPHTIAAPARKCQPDFDPARSLRCHPLLCPTQESGFLEDLSHETNYEHFISVKFKLKCI